MTPTPKQMLGGIVAVAAVLLGSSCAQIGELTDPGALTTALDTVPAGRGAETAVYFSDMTATWERGAFEESIQDNPYSATAGIGLGPLRVDSRVSPDLVPAERAPDSIAITIGEPPDQSSRFTGMDEARLGAVLDEEEGERSTVAGGELLERRDAKEVDPDDELGMAAKIGALNVVWHKGDVMVSSNDPVLTTAWVEPERTVADEGTYDDLAACLGPDVVSAFLTLDPELGLEGGATGLATGTAGTSQEDWEDVLCLRTDSPEVAAELAEALKSEIDSGQEPLAGKAWSEIYGPAEISTEGAVVRVSASSRGGAFFVSMRAGNLPVVLTPDVPRTR